MRKELRTEFKRIMRVYVGVSEKNTRVTPAAYTRSSKLPAEGFYGARKGPVRLKDMAEYLIISFSNDSMWSNWRSGRN